MTLRKRKEILFNFRCSFISSSIYRRSSVDDHAAIRMQALPRDKTTILARKENKTCCNLAGLPWSTHRYVAELLLGGSSHSCRNERCPNYYPISCYSTMSGTRVFSLTWPRTHTIHSNPIFDLLIGQTPCESDNCPLR